MGATDWYYVAVIRTDIEEWTVFLQVPEPGTLVDIKSDRIKIVAAVAEFTPLPGGGNASTSNCGELPAYGTCLNASTLLSCEDNQLVTKDCNAACGGSGTCGWWLGSYRCNC